MILPLILPAFHYNTNGRRACFPLVLKVMLKDLIKGLRLGAAYDLDSLSLEEFKKHVNIVDYKIKEEVEDGVIFFTLRT